MAKSRTRRGDKEYDLIDKLKQENKRLKRELSALRKVVDRMDLTKYEHLQELVQKRREEQKRLEKEEEKEKLRRKCYNCKEGYMILEQWPRRDGIFYNRICNMNCGNKTRMKKYHKDVKP